MKRNRHSLILWLGFICMFFSGFFFRIPTVSSLTSGGGGNPATSCIINSFYQTAGSDGSGHNFQNNRMHFWLSPLCTSASITAPAGNSTPFAVITSIVDSAGNKYGYADTVNSDVFNGDYTLTASGPTIATATLTYNAYSTQGCSLKWTGVFSTTIQWSSACGAQMRFNGVVNNTGSATLQPGINSVINYGFNTVTSQYFVIDSISFSYSSGGGGGGGGGGNATLSVRVLGLPLPKVVTWDISPGGASGFGNNSTALVVAVPSSGFNTYTLSYSYSGGTCSISNDSTGSGNAVAVWSTDGGSTYTYTLNCVPNTTATINVTSSLCTTSGLAWTIVPGGITDSGTSGSYSVTPGAGTTYTINPSVTSGTYSVTNSKGATGNVMFLQVGENQSFNISCTPPLLAPTVTLSPSSPSITLGQSSTLTWSSTNATSCSAPWTASTLTSGSQTVSPVSNTTYSVTCTGLGGSVSASATITVTVPPIPVVTISATPASGTVNVVNPTITWSATNSPTNCTASGDWSGSKAVGGGSQSMGVLTTVKTYSYTLTCSNAGGTSTPITATVGVSAALPVPVVTISASPTSGTVNVVNPSLTWSSTNSATTCTASGDWTGNRLTSNTLSMGVLTTVKTYTYTLACHNATGTSTPASATVVVSAALPVPVVTISASPSVGTVNVINPTLTWTTTNTPTSCTASGDWVGSKAVSGGSQIMGILTTAKTYTYTLACHNATGTSTPVVATVVANPVTTANISIVSNLATSSWTINPGAISGAGSGSTTVTPGAGGTLYTFTPAVVAGYTFTISPGSSLLVFPGDTPTFTVTYTALPPVPVVTISATPVSGTVNVVNPTVTWTATNSPTSCTATGDWSGAKAVAGGSQVMGILTTVKTYTYTLTCTNAGGTSAPVSDTVVVSAAPLVPTVTLSALPTPINLGNSSTITWTSTSATSCSASWTASTATSGSQSVSPVSNTTYTMTCTGAGGTGTDSVIISVNTTADISVVSNLSTAGWTIAPGGFSGTGSGSVTVSPGAGGTLYTFTPAVVAGYTSVVSPGSSFLVFPGDTPTFTVTYTPVATAPVVTLTASPISGVVNTVNPTLTWTTTNSPTSCTASGDWSGSQAVGGGSQSMGILTTAKTYTYTLTCTNAGGTSVPVSATVSVTAAVVAPVITLTASPTSGAVNTVTPTITWTTANSPTSCTASNSWSGSKSVAGGSQTLAVLTTVKTYTYTLTCSNAAGTVSKNATVVISAIPAVTISANPTSGVVNVVNPSLTWSSTNSATTCTSSGDWTGNRLTANTISMGVLTTVKTYTYTLACHNAAGTSTPVSAIVVVNPATTITVSSNLSTATWGISPGAITGTGSGSVSVVPGSSGTLYTITPATVSGYTYTVSPGSSLTVFTGDTPTFTVTYTAIVPPFDYSISATNATIAQGQVGQSTVTETLAGGVPQSQAQDVYLSLSGLPSGVAISYAPQPCKPTPTCTPTIGLNVGGTAIPGTYTITVNADTVPAGTPHSIPFTLTINPAPALSITCTASPSTAQIGQPVTWTANVTGGIPPMTYEWTGTDLPAMPNNITTNPFTFTYQTVGPKTAQVTVTDSMGSQTSCPNSTLQVGVNPSFKEF